MKKIDDIAYLYAAMMNSDDKIATIELESWYKMVKKDLRNSKRKCWFNS